MESHEGQRQQSGEIDLALQEHALLRHEHVVEDRQRLHHLVPRADRMLEVIFVRAAVRRREQLQSRRVNRQREGNCISLVLGPHRARRQHDHLVGIGRDAGVYFRAAHDDSVGTLLDDSHIVVRVILLRRSQRSIALDVGLRHRDCEIVIAAFAVVLLNALAVLGLASSRQPLADNVQRQQRVGPDLSDQHHQRRTLARRGCDQCAALEQVVRHFAEYGSNGCTRRRRLSRPRARDTWGRAPSGNRAPRARLRFRSQDAP